MAVWVIKQNVQSRAERCRCQQVWHDLFGLFLFSLVLIFVSICVCKTFCMGTTPAYLQSIHHIVFIVCMHSMFSFFSFSSHLFCILFLLLLCFVSLIILQRFFFTVLLPSHAHIIHSTKKMYHSLFFLSFFIHTFARANFVFQFFSTSFKLLASWMQAREYDNNKSYHFADIHRNEQAANWKNNGVLLQWMYDI